MSINETLSISDNIVVELTPANQARDWKRRWMEVERDLADLSQPHPPPMSAESIHASRQRLHSFFIQAYHLKDALKNEAPTLGLAPQDVENAINGEPALALLADLANLDKHGKLTKPPRSGHVPAFVTVSGESDGQSPGWRLKLTIQHGGRTVDGLQFAADAVTAWQRVLSGWGLV